MRNTNITLSILPKLCRDGLLYALALYLFEALRSGEFDVTRWPTGVCWILAITWGLVMICVGELHRARAKKASARTGY